MERLIVKGGNRLVGTVKTSGAKNAVLPIIAASILGTSPSRLDEIPALEDVAGWMKFLRWRMCAQFARFWNALALKLTLPSRIR